VFPSTHIEKIIIGSGVSNIDSSVFSDCSNLESVTLNSSYAVSRFKSAFPFDRIKEIILDNAVTSIQESAFAGCSSLTSVIISGSVTFIGNAAFSGCSALSQVCYSGINDPGKSSNYVFLNCPLDNINVVNSYADNVFCGKPTSTVGACFVESSSSSSSSSGSSSGSDKSNSNSTDSSSSSDKSNSDSSSRSSSSDKSDSKSAVSRSDSSSSPQKPDDSNQRINSLAGAELSAKPIGWFIKVLSFLLPFVIISFFL